MSTRRYSPKDARQFCARLAEGETLVAICSAPAMPGKADILDWLCSRADFRERYARARELQSHVLLEEILAIADEKREGEDAGAGEPIHSAKQRIDTRKWVIDRLIPKTSSEIPTASKSGQSRRPIIRVITGVPRARQSRSSDEGDPSRIRGPERLREVP
jgi:hypothetical protein